MSGSHWFSVCIVRCVQENWNLWEMIPRIFLRSFVSDSHLFDAVSPENHGILSTPGDDLVSAFLVRQWIHGDVSTETLEKNSQLDLRF